MKVAMQDVAKKLTLWHTPTFRPLITHDDLEPIMASIGFVSLANATPSEGLQWKEYTFGPPQPSPAAFPSDSQPRPRLPFPRIDGLHLLSYKAFLGALEHYITSTEVYNLFHVRLVYRFLTRTYLLLRPLSLPFDLKRRAAGGSWGTATKVMLIYDGATFIEVKWQCRLPAYMIECLKRSTVQ